MCDTPIFYKTGVRLQAYQSLWDRKTLGIEQYFYKCLIHLQDANGNNDAISAETFQCDVTDISCTDVNFTTYGCPVVVKEENGIDNSDTYSIKLKIKVSHVQTEDVHTIVTDITFKRKFVLHYYYTCSSYSFSQALQFDFFFSFKEPFYLVYS